ncbi:MAG: hypothetical protein F9K44_14010, partial [Hyphomicrobiaceae bacterium]
DKIGMEVQAKGVADALGLDYVHKHVNPKGLTRFLAPFSRPARRERFGEPGAFFAPPWPEVAIATGRLSIPYIRAIKRAAGQATFTVVLQDPKSGLGTADLIWVPQHDKFRGENVITTLTAAHSFTAERLAELRRSMPPEIAGLPSPRVAVVLGGKNAVYKFSDGADERLAGALSSMAALGCSFMITPSRRTHERLKRVVEEATRNAPRILWDGQGKNPYADFLAHADRLVTTADSVNMTGEACATGKPVHVFEPDRGSLKFARFHEALRAHGATRSMPDRLTELEDWSYEPLDSAHAIAAEIERRWAIRAKG